MKKSRRLAVGIREHKGTIEASVDFGRTRHTKCFPLGTPISAIHRWRSEKRLELQWAIYDDARGKRPGDYPTSPDGWCYLYIVRSGSTVKIGRAKDLRDRIKSLQVSHPTPLVLLGAAPIHATLEPQVHQRLALWCAGGEWYEMAGDVLAFIELVQAGGNPVSFVWPQTVRHVGDSLRNGTARTADPGPEGITPPASATGVAAAPSDQRVISLRSSP